MEHLNALSIFAKVAELGSFSKAADSLGVVKSTVSKAVSELEKSHNIRLFYRNPRHVTLTEEGHALLAHCRTIESGYWEAMASLERSSEQAKGLVRVSVPLLIGQLMLAQRLPGLIAEYPELSVDLDVRHTNISQLEDHTDLAIIFGQLPDSSMVAKRLAEVPIILCASAAYIAKRGKPTVPADLAEHDNLLMTLPNLRRPNDWVFKGRNGRQHPVKVQSRISMNDTLALKRAMLHDGGVTALPPYVVADELASGEAVEVLAGYRLPKVPIYAVYHSRVQMPAKVRLMIEFIREQILDYVR